MRLLLSLLVAWSALVPLEAEAKPTAAPAPSGESRFLGKDPHGPLAHARNGRLASPADSACRAWAPIGSRWSALGALGELVGKAKVSEAERYDVTNCDELSLESVSGKAGVGVFVQGDYQPMALERWRIEGRARRELERLIARRDRKLPPSSRKEKDASFSARLLSWKTPDGHQFAVVGGRGLTVLERSKGKWRVLHQIAPKRSDVAHADMYMPLAALDMDGNGSVEIVVHERFLDSYSDFTLTRKNGRYREIGAGIHGAFA